MSTGQIFQKLPNIQQEHLARIDNLVPTEMLHSLQKTTRFEVLVFVTDIEYQQTVREVDMKKLIMAKFRMYHDAEEYAQRLAMAHTYYFKIILRA